MRVLKFARLGGFLLLLLASGALQARADTIYEIIGTLTIPGNSANPGVSETINYSFMLDYTNSFQGYYPIVGTPTVTSFGPLGTLADVQSHSVKPSFLHHWNRLKLHQQVDLAVEGPGGQVTPKRHIRRYSCEGGWGLNNLSVCGPFMPLGADGSYTLHGGYGPATAAVYLVSTPEPGTLCLLVFGTLGLGFLKKRVRS